MDGWGMMAWGWIFSILIPGLLVASLVFVLTGRRAASGSGDALGVLQERYARGEIDHGEYEERAAVLRGRAPPERRT
ncbi:MAG: SHOCT domain-containing protein [Candidatus Limnocylindria bacterium]